MKVISWVNVLAAAGLSFAILAPTLGSAAPTAAQTSDASSSGPKVLRYAFQIAETGFDPVQTSDAYSKILISNMFDALYAYDYLSRPMVMRPSLAQGMPEITNDYKTWTVKIKPGILFADDPAFGGKKREVTAQDVVYTYQRHYDPKNKDRKSVV